MREKMVLAVFLHVFLLSLMTVSCALAWSNGGYSVDPSNPDYGTHDWIAEHALDWLPDQEKQYMLGSLATYLYGTELPDNGGAPDGIGDTIQHHIYYNSTGVTTDDAAAVRASTEYNNTLNFLKAKDYAMAAKRAGVMSHYIADMAVFGHVMASDTDWGPEVHHSDYETYVNEQTSSYSSKFNSYLSFDGSLTTLSAYNAAKNLAYDTTFDVEGDLTCVWMDQNYNWSNSIFKDRAGESLDLAVNFLADVLHTLYLEANPETVTISVPRDYGSVQQAIDSANPGSIIHVERGVYDPFVISKSLTIEGESVDNTVIDGKGTGTVILITADYASIKDFKIQNGNIGIEISGSKSNIVSSNLIINNDHGVVLSNCTENTIDRNTIRDNNYGVALDTSDRNVIKRNTASNNIYGIDVRYSRNNTIECNNLASNVNDGLHLYDCRYNSIKRNMIELNGQNGIYVKYSFDNTLSHNNFINNTSQLYQYDSSNSWFSIAERWNSTAQKTEKVPEGNCWSDYAGADTDGDGIGETLLPHQGIDYYPLMKAWSPYPIARFTWDPLLQMVDKTVTLDASASYDEDGTIKYFTWDFGDGNTTRLEEQVISHMYATFGDYKVTLTVTDNDALASFLTAYVTIYTIPTVKFAYYPHPPTVGQSVTFNASLSTPNGGTIVNYSWDFETDGVIDATGMIVNHTYTSPGTYRVTLNVTNDGGLTHRGVTDLLVAAPATHGLIGWLQSPTGIAVVAGGTAAIAIGVPVMLLKRRKPPTPVLVPPKASPSSAPTVPLSTSPKLERGPKAVITVSKTNGEYTVMVEGPENYPVKLKHQFKVDEKMKLDLIRDFDTTALIANYWRMSRSGTPAKEPPKVQTLDITAHLERSGRLMYRYLTPLNIGRFFKTVKIDHLWLEIDESLLEIPWELMHDGDDFICLKYAVGRRLLTGQIYEAKPPRILKKPRFLLVGDPSEELPDAKKEIQLLAKRLEKLPNVEVTALSGSEITKLDFLQMLSEGKYDCIHFAGHAGFNVERPDESYLKFNDALCYAYETKRLVNEENPPEIVFVNACSSAKEAGQTAYEKEIGGLAKAFLFKGSMGYIGALWPVHDEAVARLSVSFYTKLVSGVSVGEALRQARRESYSEHKGKEIAWASFTLYGDPNLKLF